MKLHKIKSMLLSPWTAIFTLAVFLFVRGSDPTFIESMRLKYFDILINSKAVTQNNIWTVNIDEQAINQYGQWPFNREIYAKIIQDLYDRNAGLVVFNVLMPEPDRQGGDSILAETLKEFPVVLPNTPTMQTKNMPKNPGASILNPQYMNMIITFPGLLANIEVLEQSATGIGSTHTLAEVDGVNRRLPLVVQVDGKLYPSVPLEVLRLLANDKSFQIKLSEIGVDKLRIPKFGIINTDTLGRIWIDFSQKFNSTSVSKLPDDFNGSIVIVGTTAAGITNPISSPMGNIWPQDLQAHVIATLTNSINIERPNYSDGLELISIGMVGILLLFLTRWTYVGLATTLVLILASVVASMYLFHEYLILFDATAMVATLIIVALHAYGMKFVSEYIQKQQIKKQFGSYVNPTIVERLQKDPSLIKLGGEKREMTIVMSDLRGFTPLGESYGDDVEGLVELMNNYMTAISEPVLKNDGCIIKFIGDASLHVHNAPLDDSNHAVNGVKTALEMIAAVDKFNQHLQTIGKPKIGMGTGINTGPTLVGNIGSKDKFGYDVLGDSVSTAARLEGQSKPYGVLNVLGPRTNQLVKDVFATVELDYIAVKGKKVGLNIYTALGTHEQLWATTNYVLETETHNKMLALYRAQKFDMAIKFCQDLKGAFDGKMDHYYEIWIERCQEMKTKNLPKDWDGIYIANTK